MSLFIYKFRHTSFVTIILLIFLPLRLLFLQTASVGRHKRTRTLTMVRAMLHQLLKTVRQRASAIPNVLESTGIQRLQRINAAGWVDLGLVRETTALRVASLTGTWTEAVLVSQL